MGDGDIEDADDLFGLDPEAFVAARDALARRLRSAGRKDEAAAVKALRRPTVAAWVLNQLVRRHGEDVRALIAEGQQVAHAQGRALAGEGAGLREATMRRREAIRRLAQQADTILAGRSAAGHHDDVVATLTAASADPEAGERLLAGRLASPIPATTGFGGTSLLASPEPVAPVPGPDTGPGTGRDAARVQAEREAAEARRAADEERARADEAMAAAEQAAALADASDEEVRRLEADLERARRAAGDDARRAREAASRAAAAGHRADAAEERASRAAVRTD